MSRLTTARVSVLLLVFAIAASTATGQSSPDGQITIAFDASIASSFLDPAETPGIGSPFVFLYALHDALIKPLPGNDMAPCLAESWRESPDGLVYEFKLREGLRFHNGDPFTAEDVKWSFLRYHGISAKMLHERVKAVEVVDPHRVRFVLHTPWPDFLVFYATPATGAAWIVPKKYVEKVGEEGFKRQPVGLGPYRFVRLHPGVELVLEANEQYWRRKPSIKRVVIKGVPDRTTRLAMLKTGETDIAYLMIGLEATTIKDDPQAPTGPRHPVRDMVVGFSGAVESQVSVARSPGPTGGESGHRQARHKRGRASGLLASDGVDHSQRHAVRPAHGPLSV
jgi:ABC-type transport system substrate-binding protein